MFLERDAKLMKQMADPRFSRAIEFMQRDPEGCKSYYMNHDPEFFKEFIEFFKKNMERIGSHIETKADQKPKQKTEDEKKMEEILKRYYLSLILHKLILVSLDRKSRERCQIR